MFDLFLIAYLVAPAVLGIAAFFYAVTRTPDRIHLASVCLFACTFAYLAAAYELAKAPSSSLVLGSAIGVYALFLSAAMAALALQFKRWAWRVALAAFGLHLLGGLLGTPAAIQQGTLGILVLLAYMSIGALGLWAALHKGTRSAITPEQHAEA